MTDKKKSKQRWLGRRVEALEEVVRESEIGSLLQRVEDLGVRLGKFDEGVRATRKRLKEVEGELDLQDDRIEDLESNVLSLADRSMDPLASEGVRGTTIDRILGEDAFRTAVEGMVEQVVEDEVIRAFLDWEEQTEIDEHLVRLAEKRAISRARLAKKNLSSGAREKLLEEALAIGAVTEEQATEYRREHGLESPGPCLVEEASSRAGDLKTTRTTGAMQ